MIKFSTYNIEQETKYVMSDSDFNRLVSDHLPKVAKDPDRYKNFECVAEFEWNNDSNYDTDIAENYKLDNYERKEIVGGTHYLGFHQVMCFLVELNILPYGKYEVKVSW